MSLILAQSTIYAINFVMLRLEKLSAAKSPAHIDQSRQRSASAVSEDSASSKLCDSGYNSDVDHPEKGTFPSQSNSSSHCAKTLQDRRPKLHLQLQDAIANAPKKDPDRIVIRHEHLLYGIIAVMAAIMIDKKLLIPAIAALALAVIVLSVFAPVTDVERLLDLSAFHVDWKPKVEIVHRDVIKYIEKPACLEVVKTVCVDKPVEVVKEIEVIKEVEKPVDRVVFKLVPQYIVKTETVNHYFVKTEVVREKVNHYWIKDESSKKPIYHATEEQAKSELEEARLPPRFLIEEVLPAGSNAMDEKPKKKKKQNKHRGRKGGKKVQKTRSNKLAATASVEEPSVTAHSDFQEPIVKDAPVTIGKKLRCIPVWKIFVPDAPKMPPYLIHAAFDHAFDEWLDDYEKVSRTLQRIPTVDDLLKDKISNAEKEELSFMVMPQPYPGSPATMPGYDPWRVTATTSIEYGVPCNPYGWAETKTKHIYVSVHMEGMWMFHTADAAIVIQWKPLNQVWWCEEFGFGFHQNTPEEDPDHPCRFFFGQFDDQDQDSDMFGPVRTKDPAGPYWRSAVEEFWAFKEKFMKEQWMKQENLMEEQRRQSKEQYGESEVEEEGDYEEEQKEGWAGQREEERQKREELAAQFQAAFLATQEEQEKQKAEDQARQRLREEGAKRLQANADRIAKEKEDDRLERETPQMPKQGDRYNARYRAAQEDASQQSRRQRAPRMTPEEAAAETRRKRDEELASWDQRKPEEKKKAVFGEKMF
jgi:hypothetical protein